MIQKRLEFALERITPGDWERFEKLCSAFLVPEWQGLRTVASPSGDRGRDAELFSPESDTSVMIQFSVEKSWDAKIRRTVDAIKTNFPAVSVLVFMSNQVIGPKADELRARTRSEKHMILDIRDRAWFVERVATSEHREAAAESLAQAIVDPYLGSKDLLKNKAQALSSDESRAALIYLGLQWQDDTREKGLTKLCFEALVRAALRETTSERRITRENVRAAIRSILATHPAEKVIRTPTRHCTE